MGAASPADVVIFVVLGGWRVLVPDGWARGATRCGAVRCGAVRCGACGAGREGVGCKNVTWEHVHVHIRLFTTRMRVAGAGLSAVKAGELRGEWS